jgi:two-component system CheB/CheR fusion protein
MTESREQPDVTSLDAAGDDRFLVVGVGASAGGLAALRGFFGPVPEEPGMAFIVVQHLSPSHSSQLVSLLQAKCEVVFETAIDGTPVAPDTVYVISPGTELTVEDGQLHVEQRPSHQPNARRLPIDLLFRSLASEYGSRAVGVVLSGTGTDGTLGVRALAEAGALTVAQSPTQAEYDGMPRSVIGTESVDLVLDTGEMWAHLQTHARLISESDEVLETPDDPDYGTFASILQVVADRVEHDFKDYKTSTLVRRIERRMQVNACKTLDEYLHVIRRRDGEAEALFHDLLISVTQFFRDPRAFEQLRTDVLPKILENKETRDDLRIWVAGCASGEEAYSVAMMAVEAVDDTDVNPAIQIFATDIDYHALEVARRGHYPQNIAADITEERLKRFFVAKDGEYVVHPMLRELILFSEHNVLQDPPFSRIDLLLCRNVLIYLDRSAHPRLMRVFNFALRPSGYLFTGVSESAKGSSHLFSEVPGLDSVFQVGTGKGDRQVFPRIGLEAKPVSELLDRMKRAKQANVSIETVHQKALLAQYAPPSVVINKHRELVHITGGAGEFMHMSDGTPTTNIAEISPKALGLALRTVLHQRLSDDQDIVEHQVRFKEGDEHKHFILRARWLPYADEGDRLVQVSFEEPRTSLDPQPNSFDLEGEVGELVDDLERELAYTREQLQVTIEEYETALEELRASNEELQSVNEELHSTTEELETSREELRSVNEELSTVNEELRAKIEELNENHVYLENLLRSTQIGSVFLDGDKCITHYTPSVGELFRLSPVDVGRPLSDLTHSMSYPELQDDIEHVLETETELEREVESDNGRWFIARLLPFYRVDGDFGGLVLSFIDITRRKAAELQLARSEERYRTLFEGANDGIYVYEMEQDFTPGALIDANEVIAARLGYEANALIGKRFEEITDTDADTLDELREALEADGEYLGERREVTVDGELIDVEVNSRLLEMDQQPCVLTVSRDFTARKEYEQQLIAAKLAAERLAQMQSSFVANMSHEVRTPLTSVIGLSQMLGKRLENGESQRMARIIERSANRLMRTLDSVLTLAKIDAGEAVLEFDEFDLYGEVESLLSTMRPLADEKQLELRLESERQPFRVNNNREAVSRILSNLIGNSIKFTHDGAIIVKLDEDADMLRLVVQDTGVGIDEEFLPYMYEQFRQESTGDSREFGGIGLGLTIVKRIVELLDGTIDVESVKGDGTLISVILPRQPAQMDVDESGESWAE